jgi:cell division protein FtsI/penicillin-binding protein 2
MSNRLLFFRIAAGVWILGIVLRLASLQLVHHEEYLKRSLHTQRIVENVRRAAILDRNGRILAGSIPAYNLKVAFDARHARFTHADLSAMAGILRMPLSDVEEASRRDSGFVVLASRTTLEQIRQLRALNLKDLLLPQESERIYPYGALLEHVVGFVDDEGDGQSGLERYYDGILRGQPGETMVLRDSLRFSYDLGQEITPPVPGTDLQLALDIPLQYTCMRALQELEGVCHPVWASATVMNPCTGELLAHAITPSFDPAQRGQAYDAYGRRQIRDEHLAGCPFEPGSIIKPVLATAVLRAGLTRPSENFNCGHGRITLLGRTIEDHAVFDNLSFTETIMFSSNVGCIKWGQRLTGPAFLECLRRFGFGKRTGLDLRPESPGLLPAAKRVNALSQAYMSIGQGMSVTHAQILQAYSALANGGWRVAPHFIKGAAAPAERILDPGVQATLRDILFQTVVGGTGRKAQVEGAALAGKTGTAQKADRSGYEKGSYVSSFIGWFPADRPRYLILVVVDEPHGLYYGSDVAAPVAHDIAFFLHVEGESRASV